MVVSIIRNNWNKYEKPSWEFNLNISNAFLGNYQLIKEYTQNNTEINQNCNLQIYFNVKEFKFFELFKTLLYISGCKTQKSDKFESRNSSRDTEKNRLFTRLVSALTI